MKTKQHRLLFFFSLLLISLIRAQAEPLNVMVQDLTFTRPEAWRWAEPTDKSPAVTRFIVPDSNGFVSADIRFYVVRRGYTNEKTSLITQFPDAKPGDLHEREIKIGHRRVVYYEIAGTYHAKDHPPKSDQLVVGAAIPLGKEYVYARIQGARAEVEPEVARFKKMVEDAVMEREADLAAN